MSSVEQSARFTVSFNAVSPPLPLVARMGNKPLPLAPPGHCAPKPKLSSKTTTRAAKSLATRIKSNHRLHNKPAAEAAYDALWQNAVWIDVVAYMGWAQPALTALSTALAVMDEQLRTFAGGHVTLGGARDKSMVALFLGAAKDSVDALALLSSDHRAASAAVAALRCPQAKAFWCDALQNSWPVAAAGDFRRAVERMLLSGGREDPDECAGEVTSAVLHSGAGVCRAAARRIAHRLTADVLLFSAGGGEKGSGGGGKEDERSPYPKCGAVDAVGAARAAAKAAEAAVAKEEADTAAAAAAATAAKEAALDAGVEEAAYAKGLRERQQEETAGQQETDGSAGAASLIPDAFFLWCLDAGARAAALAAPGADYRATDDTSRKGGSLVSERAAAEHAAAEHAADLPRLLATRWRRLEEARERGREEAEEEIQVWKEAARKEAARAARDGASFCWSDTLGLEVLEGMVAAAEGTGDGVAAVADEEEKDGNGHCNCGHSGEDDEDAADEEDEDRQARKAAAAEAAAAATKAKARAKALASPAREARLRRIATAAAAAWAAAAQRELAWQRQAITPGSLDAWCHAAPLPEEAKAEAGANTAKAAAAPRTASGGAMTSLLKKASHKVTALSGVKRDPRRLGRRIGEYLHAELPLLAALRALRSATGGDGWSRQAGWLTTHLMADWRGLEMEHVAGPEEAVAAKVKAEEAAEAAEAAARESESAQGDVSMRTVMAEQRQRRNAELAAARGGGRLLGEAKAAAAARKAAEAEAKAEEALAVYEDEKARKHAHEAAKRLRRAEAEAAAAARITKAIEDVGEGRLLALNLADNSLVGTLPPSGPVVWAPLGRTLLRLHLQNNGLSGGVPAALGECGQLRVLSLNGNALQGALPSKLFTGLLALRQLHLQGNALSGELPNTVGTIEALRVLRLDDNELSGALPKALGQLSRLEVLSAAGNRFSGAVPPELCCCKRLVELDLDRNALEGALPRKIGALEQLRLLSAAANNLSGALPESLGKLHNLTDLFLQENALTGELPPSLGHLDKLQKCYLFMNQLSGPLPGALKHCRDLENVQLWSNNLEGPLPELGNLRKLRVVQVQGNPRLLPELPRWEMALRAGLEHGDELLFG